jgi:nucleotide-binding universal stress UspA family protein
MRMQIKGVDRCQYLPFTCLDWFYSRTDAEEDDAMHATEIQEYARQLLEAHGAKAIAEAAQKAVAFERAGDKKQAETWRRVEAALMLMRGPRQA